MRVAESVTPARVWEVYMDSSIIGKIEKAKRYAQEKDRVEVSGLTATFQGDHDTYQVGLSYGAWNCQCHFFSSRGVCSHTMAIQRILDELLGREAKIASPL